MNKMQENTDRDLGKSSEDIINECMVLSALDSTALALESGLRKDQIIISCKVSRPLHLIAVYRELAKRTDQPLHLGLTEAGMGIKGLVWSASAMGALLNEGIGDTIRVSLTPRPGGDRREEVYAACELLQALGLRSFAPSVTACPGCGRTTSTTFQELAERTQDYIREMMPVWKHRYEGVEEMTLAVMGCVVNGPGESKAANIGISLPGTGEEPSCPIYIDGQHVRTLRGTYDELAVEFKPDCRRIRRTEIREGRCRPGLSLVDRRVRFRQREARNLDLEVLLPRPSPSDTSRASSRTASSGRTRRCTRSSRRARARAACRRRRGRALPARRPSRR